MRCTIPRSGSFRSGALRSVVRQLNGVPTFWTRATRSRYSTLAMAKQDSKFYENDSAYLSPSVSRLVKAGSRRPRVLVGRKSSTHKLIQTIYELAYEPSLRLIVSMLAEDKRLVKEVTITELRHEINTLISKIYTRELSIENFPEENELEIGINDIYDNLVLLGTSLDDIILQASPDLNICHLLHVFYSFRVDMNMTEFYENIVFGEGEHPVAFELLCLKDYNFTFRSFQSYLVDNRQQILDLHYPADLRENDPEYYNIVSYLLGTEFWYIEFGGYNNYNSALSGDRISFEDFTRSHTKKYIYDAYIDHLEVYFRNRFLPEDYGLSIEGLLAELRDLRMFLGVSKFGDSCDLYASLDEFLDCNKDELDGNMEVYRSLICSLKSNVIQKDDIQRMDDFIDNFDEIINKHSQICESEERISLLLNKKLGSPYFQGF